MSQTKAEQRLHLRPVWGSRCSRLVSSARFLALCVSQGMVDGLNNTRRRRQCPKRNRQAQICRRKDRHIVSLGVAGLHHRRYREKKRKIVGCSPAAFVWGSVGGSRVKYVVRLKRSWYEAAFVRFEPFGFAVGVCPDPPPPPAMAGELNPLALLPRGPVVGGFPPEAGVLPEDG